MMERFRHDADGDLVYDGAHQEESGEFDDGRTIPDGTVASCDNCDGDARTVVAGRALCAGCAAEETEGTEGAAREEEEREAAARADSP